MKQIKVRLTFTTEVFGTAPNNESIYEEFILKQDPENDITCRADEIETIGADAVIEKGMTVFHKDEEGPFLFDYMINGFLKEACASIKRADKTFKVSAHKQKFDGNVTVLPRRIHFQNIAEDAIYAVQRPLRAETAQGPRVSLVCSEAIPAGATVSFLIITEDDALEDVIVKCLDHGCVTGIGQWRGSGNKGQFYWERIGDDGEVIYSNRNAVMMRVNFKPDW